MKAFASVGPTRAWIIYYIDKVDQDKQTSNGYGIFLLGVQLTKVTYIKSGLMLFELTKNNPPRFIFSPLAQENCMASQGHEIKIMNKVNLCYVNQFQIN